MLAAVADWTGWYTPYAILETWWLSMTWDQWFLTIFSLLGAWLITDTRPAVRRWGPVFGLCSQPFWLYTASINGQPGVLIMAGVYTVVWMRGVVNFWFRAPAELPQLPRVPRQ